MRVNLKVPYSEKDQAKAAGARWDQAKRVWYIKDAESLQPFSRWLGNDVRAFYRKPKNSPERKTHPAAGFQPLCNCITPPWEDCEHTEAQVQNILATDYGISQNING